MVFTKGDTAEKNGKQKTEEIEGTCNGEEEGERNEKRVGISNRNHLA